MLDAIRANHFAYSLVTPSKISSSWIKADILSIEHVEGICEKHGLRYPRDYYKTPGSIASSDTTSDVVIEARNENCDASESTSDGVSDITQALSAVETNSVPQNVDKEIGDWLEELSNEESNRTRYGTKSRKNFCSTSRAYKASKKRRLLNVLLVSRRKKKWVINVRLSKNINSAMQY